MRVMGKEPVNAEDRLTRGRWSAAAHPVRVRFVDPTVHRIQMRLELDLAFRTSRTPRIDERTFRHYADYVQAVVQEVRMVTSEFQLGTW